MKPGDKVHVKLPNGLEWDDFVQAEHAHIDGTYLFLLGMGLIWVPPYYLTVIEEHKRCPFCGGEAKIQSGTNCLWPECTTCKTSPGGWWITEAEAWAAWDKRV